MKTNLLLLAADSADAALGILLSLGIGILLFIAIIGLLVYVLASIGKMKALKAMDYGNAWMAWIPFLNYYALADATSDEPTELLPGVSVPAIAFKLWWVLLFILPAIPVIGGIAVIALNVICMGYCYKTIYAVIDDKAADDVAVLAYLSAVIGLIPFIKFLTIKNK